MTRKRSKGDPKWRLRFALQREYVTLFPYPAEYVQSGKLGWWEVSVVVKHGVDVALSVTEPSSNERRFWSDNATTTMLMEVEKGMC